MDSVDNAPYVRGAGKCSDCITIDGRLRKCSFHLIRQKVYCRTTCGCGYMLVEYSGQRPNKGEILLTCIPYSPRYEHPSLIVLKTQIVNI